MSVNGLHFGKGIHPGYRSPGSDRILGWSVHCSRRPCQDRDARFGHWNTFSRATKAEFAKELIHDGWTYRGDNRWWCAKCSAVASGRRILKHEDWGLFRTTG